MTLTASSTLSLQLEKTDHRKKANMSPIGKYFDGHGSKVLADMQKRQGPNAGKRTFYATANARGMTPSDNDGDEARPPRPAPKKRMSLGQRIGAKE